MKVCFFSPTAYAYFYPTDSGWAGGAENQQVMIAKHMVNRGINVSFIVGDYGQPDAELVEGITLIKSFEPFKGNRKLRFVSDMLKIQRAMKIADADIYNQRSTSFFTGQLSYFASRLGRPFTFSIGIDYNCYPDGGGLLPLPISLLYRYGIRNSAAVIAQSHDQKRIFSKNFDKEPVVIRNGIEIVPRSEMAPSENHIVPAAPDADASIARTQPKLLEFLWVGSIRRRKHPELYLDLAQAVPEADFTLIGGEGDDEAFYREIVARTETIENLHYEGFIPHRNITQYYRRCFAYVNTSTIEGFPNTYLYSWMYGAPVLTIEIDPDRIIVENGIGETTGSFEGLVEAVRRLCQNPGRRIEMSRRARDYVERHHDIAVTGDNYIELFERLLTSSSRSRSSRSA
ncbi:MAG: glycosyltransferase family 4 protein [bacterium]|nr:MAG: glycosyltransferase family 4 protein [bacterium]